MNVEFPMNEYEYKSPSYEQKERKKSFVIHEEQCTRESRYVYKDGIYYSKEKEKDEISLLFTGETSFTAENNEERLTGISAPDYFYYGTNFVINVLL